MHSQLTLFVGQLAIASGFLLAATESPTGKFVSSAKGQITIMLDSQRQVSYDLSEKAMVLLDNRPSTLEKVSLGDTVTLTLEDQNSKRVVTMVDAKSKAEKSGRPIADVKSVGR
jgi:hypothetical protein